ncbi:hypothetical protein M422DRAFT_248523 [Sphaerobolus stellatus SS14]|uniref:Uncharacterized protein n=1 Tax=Sphaerobolus stellatus (strain SS14) TaxID=990650 RepID=A0A0C9W5X4_SPHS4|nr:hypothetical protein M422DRAFT_248523 [Sphaerobolus stellatus SS14]
MRTFFTVLTVLVVALATSVSAAPAPVPGEDTIIGGGCSAGPIPHKSTTKSYDVWAKTQRMEHHIATESETKQKGKVQKLTPREFEPLPAYTDEKPVV